jgi:hypothetical protein
MLYQAASMIITNSLRHARHAELQGDLTAGEIFDETLLVDGHYRRSIGRGTQRVLAAFQLVDARHVVGHEYDTVTLVGYEDDVDLLHLFGASIVQQATSALSWYWNHHHMQGQADLLLAYRYKRDFIDGLMRELLGTVTRSRTDLINEASVIDLLEARRRYVSQRITT